MYNSHISCKKKLQFEIQDEWPSLLGGNFGLLLGITEIIKTVYFNGKETVFIKILYLFVYVTSYL